MHPRPLPLETGASENQVGALGLSLGRGQGLGVWEGREGLEERTKEESWGVSGKIWGAQENHEALGVLDSWRKRRSWGMMGGS